MNQFAKARKIPNFDRKAVKTRTSIFTAWSIYSMDGEYLGTVRQEIHGYSANGEFYPSLGLAAVAL